MVELGADADERAPRVERLAHDLEQRPRAVSSTSSSRWYASSSSARSVVEQAGRAADVEALLLARERLGEERA